MGESDLYCTRCCSTVGCVVTCVAQERISDSAGFQPREHAQHRVCQSFEETVPTQNMAGSGNRASADRFGYHQAVALSCMQASNLPEVQMPFAYGPWLCCCVAFALQASSVNLPQEPVVC